MKRNSCILSFQPSLLCLSWLVAKFTSGNLFRNRYIDCRLIKKVFWRALDSIRSGTQEAGVGPMAAWTIWKKGIYFLSDEIRTLDLPFRSLVSILKCFRANNNIIGRNVVPHGEVDHGTWISNAMVCKRLFSFLYVGGTDETESLMRNVSGLETELSRALLQVQDVKFVYCPAGSRIWFYFQGRGKKVKSDVRFSRHCWWRLKYFDICCRVDW